MLFKDPKTDDGTKRSQRGHVVVGKKEDILSKNPDFDFSTLTGDQKDNNLLWLDGLNTKDVDNHKEWNALRTVFLDGKLLIDESLSDIRKRLNNE